jgi:uncharacterized membrane protein YphA (DoxX/SURF4 family)
MRWLRSEMLQLLRLRLRRWRRRLWQPDRSGLTSVQKLGILVGRLCLAIPACASGVGRLLSCAGPLDYLESLGLPGRTATASILLATLVLAHVLLGLCLALGHYTRGAAAALLMLLMLDSLLPEAMEAGAAIPGGLRTLAAWPFAGGLLVLLLCGGGPWSCDARRRRLRELGDSNVLA